MIQIQNGVTLEFIKTAKFKDVGISIRFMSALDKRTAAARSLLALMMCDRTKKYDSKQKMSELQDSLYGATLSSQTVGYGAAQVIELRSKFIDPSYLKKDNTLLKDVFAFLHEVIFEPLLEEHVFDEFKNVLKAKIERMQDDPAQYAVSAGLKAAGQDTYLGISALGELTDVDSLTLEDIQNTYQKMIQEDHISMIVCGNMEEEVMRTIVHDSFPFQARNGELTTFYKADNKLQHNYSERYKNISQSYIMMTWFTNTVITDEAFYHLRVANAMLGQYSTSLLFQEVREKNSLCYTIYSNLIAYDAALGITTGVEKENVTKTIDLIKQQFQRLVSGDFEESLLTVSKQMIVNSLKAGKDNMNSLIALAYQNELLGTTTATEDIIMRVEKVTREDVISAMQNCQEKMTFVLTKEDAHETNTK